MQSVQNLCTNGLLIQNGTSTFYGPIGETVAKYLNTEDNQNRLTIDLKNIKERKEIISNEKETIKEIIKGDYQEEEKKSEVFELEQEILIKDTIQELKALQNLKTKKKKDSSKLDKFLKKLGVEEPEKKKPEFEIDQ